MKIHFIALLLVLSFRTFAATDTIPAATYAFAHPAARSKGIKQQVMVSGNSSHLKKLSVIARTLSAGQKYPARPTAFGYETLIIIKEGRLRLSIGDSSKNLTSGAIALAVVNDPYQFVNTSSEPVTFYTIELISKTPIDPERDVKGKGSFMKNWDELKKTDTDKGESRPIFDQATPMFSRFDAHATALNPGISSHDPHTHAAEEIILIIKGDVTEQIGQSTHPATTGDVIYLASNVLHKVTNTGKTPCGYFAIQWRE